MSLTRLQLRAQLYKQADRPEDQAAMIIEQVRRPVLPVLQKVIMKVEISTVVVSMAHLTFNNFDKN